MSEVPQVIKAADVKDWAQEVDVIVAGQGIAGSCAAIEAHRAGSDVLVIERASGGGGASALSSGILYLGGGTAVQKACGYDDDPEEMFKFMMANCGTPDARIVRDYCDNNVEHFDWLESLGVPFERSVYKDKAVYLLTTHCLFSTGNEKLWPYSEIAKPTLRGHKVAGAGENAGSAAMEAILRVCREEGVPAIYDAAVIALVMDDAGRIVGVQVKQDGKLRFIRARNGVILATGGFNLNYDLLKKYLPILTETSDPLGIPSNDGAGMLLGQSAGGALQAMDGMVATASFYPPAKLIKGILVNIRGERFVAEDSYHGRTAQFIAEQPKQTAYLIVDSETFAYPELEYHRHTLIDGWETVAEMEAGLKLPEGSLQATMDYYNKHAAEGRDPHYYKAKEWLQPLNNGPYAAFDVSFNKSHYYFMTLGGLQVNPKAQVINTDGNIIPGLYAVGACAVSIPQSGKGYGSGMSLGPGSYFGRVAGKHAAAVGKNA